MHLAPIQTDRLVGRTGSIPSLPALSSATNLGSQSHYSSHTGMPDVPRSSTGMNVNSQYSSGVPAPQGQSQHSPSHDGQMQYQYSSVSNYSSLSANGSHGANNWRPDVYRRSSLAV